MTEDLLAEMILEDLLNYISYQTDEWDDPTGDTAVYLAEKTSISLEKEH